MDAHHLSENLPSDTARGQNIIKVFGGEKSESGIKKISRSTAFDLNFCRATSKMLDSDWIKLPI